MDGGSRGTSLPIDARTAATVGTSYSPMTLMTPTEELTSGRTRHWDLAPIIASFGVLFYVLRVIGAVWRSDLALFFPDSFSYLSVAELGPFTTDFWFAERPVGAPLLLWLCGLNLRLFFLVQTALFALSVMVLCRALFALMSSRLVAWVTVGALVAFSVHPRFGLWHLELLSESLGLSLSLLAIALWLRVAQELSPSRLRWATLVTAGWLLARDAHVMTVVIISVVLVVIAMRTPQHNHLDRDLRRTLLRSVGALALVAVYVVAAQSTSDRNQYPLMNNIGLRILPDANMTKAFTERGMPVNAALTARSGRDTWDDEETFLRSPDLTEFRSWVNGSGQLVQMSSLVLDADFWISETADVLPTAVKYDFKDYDRFNTSDRLPQQLFWFGGLQSPVGLGVATVLGAGVALALLVQARRRPIGVVIATGLLATGLDLYLSTAADAVEVLRHLIGPILRLGVFTIVALGLGADWAFTRWLSQRRSRPVDEFPRSRIRPMAALATSVAALGIFMTWVALEYRTQDFDPQYTRTIVERAATFGGSYYQNGIHNKGPLETALYDSARLFTSYETFWFAISAYVLAISALLGLTAGLIMHAISASRLVAVIAGSLVTIHFSLSSSDYAGVLYSRNITTALISGVLAATLWSKLWSTPQRANTTFILSGVAIGLAIQTLLTTILAGAVIITFVIAQRGRSTTFRRPVITMAVTLAAAVLSAPLWYAIRNSFDEFWSGWWIYARSMSSGTGRSLLDQIGLGVERFVGYYQERPVVLIALTIFAVVTWGEWSGFSPARRRLHAALIMWFIAAWIELVLAQRYSSHYFSVVAVPSAFMAAITVVSVIQALRERRLTVSNAVSSPLPRQRTASYGTALLASGALLALQGTDLFWAGVEGASSFRNTNTHVQQRFADQSGSDRTSRAVIDLVSTRGDALLAWTMYPWTYLEHERVPATRLIWKSFMIGEIYLGRTSAEYVLDDTWSWFAEDLAESRPEVYARPIETDLVDGVLFNGVIEDLFTTVYTGPDLEIGLSRTRWEALRASDLPLDLRGPESPLDLGPTEPEEIGWSIDLSAGRSMNITADQANEPLLIASGTCRRFDGIMVGDDSTIRFSFIDPTRRSEILHLGLDFTRAWSESETMRYLEQLLDPEPVSEVSFSLLVGLQSAALIVNNEIVAAIRLPGKVNVALDSGAGDLDIRNLTIRTASALNGC